MDLANYILRPATAIYVTLAFALLSLAEAAVLSRFQKYDWKCFGASVANLGFHWVGLFLLPFSISAPLVKYFAAHAITEIPLSGWQAFLLLFFLLELCQYWFHRASHRIRWFWISHAVHHSPNNFNLSVGYRAGSFLRLTGTLIFFLPLFWLGLPPKAILAALAVSFWLQTLLHFHWIPKLGWLEYVLNTPSAHRVHHARNPEYLDANYGSALIIFDRMFGTYVEEKASAPCQYGLVNPQLSNNPFRIEFDPWLEFLRDLKSSRSMREFLGYVFCPPGWKPRAGSEPTGSGPGEQVRERLNA